MKPQRGSVTPRRCSPQSTGMVPANVLLGCVICVSARATHAGALTALKGMDLV